MDFLSTVKGSLMEDFLPSGWDMEKIARCCSLAPEEAAERQSWWNPEFEPVACGSFEDFNVLMGHEMAREIQQARAEGRELAHPTLGTTACRHPGVFRGCRDGPGSLATHATGISQFSHQRGTHMCKILQDGQNETA